MSIYPKGRKDHLGRPVNLKSPFRLDSYPISNSWNSNNKITKVIKNTLEIYKKF